MKKYIFIAILAVSCVVQAGEHNDMDHKSGNDLDLSTNGMMTMKLFPFVELRLQEVQAMQRLALEAIHNRRAVNNE